MSDFNVRPRLLPVLKVGGYMEVYEWQVFESRNVKWETKPNFIDSNRWVLAIGDIARGDLSQSGVIHEGLLLSALPYWDRRKFPSYKHTW